MKGLNVMESPPKIPRRPSFLANVAVPGDVAEPGFLRDRSGRGRTPISATFEGSTEAGGTTPKSSTEAANSLAGSKAAAQAATQPVTFTPTSTVFHEKLVLAVDAFKLQGERLAEQARADALEIAFLLAHRILGEAVRANPESLFALIRSAIQRVGESRSVAIRLHPEDAQLVESMPASAVAVGLTVATTKIVADPTLERGDCVIETNFGQVDGRISTRLAQLREAIADTVEGGSR